MSLSLITAFQKPAVRRFSLSNLNASRPARVLKRIARTIPAGAIWGGIAYFTYNKIGLAPAFWAAASGTIHCSTLLSGRNRTRYKVGAAALAGFGMPILSLISLQSHPTTTNLNPANFAIAQPLTEEIKIAPPMRPIESTDIFRSFQDNLL